MNAGPNENGDVESSNGHIKDTIDQALLLRGSRDFESRDVIDSLVRKPGAFENYKYREDMFPTSHFRIAYDLLCEAHSAKVAVRKYLAILALAARESQDAVQDALRHAIQAGEPIDVDRVRASVEQATHIPPATDVPRLIFRRTAQLERFRFFTRAPRHGESVP